MEKKPYSDKRWTQALVGKSVQCNSCKHYKLFAKCEAFPEGIPKELMTHEITHNKPFKGDGGILYEKIN